MRKHWIDNLRWVTVLLVLLYHVIYFYNNKGVFGGIGGWGEYPEWHQYQDVVMYILYPWFMPLLFLLAGISSRYALQKQSAKDWFKARTRKLLVPGTIGLFVFHWMVGYFNSHLAGQDMLAQVPQPVKFFIWGLTGTGALWFIQLLWVLCLVLLLVRVLDRNDRFWSWCGKAGIVPVILLGVLFWAAQLTMVQNPSETGMDGLLNLYKPIFYLIIFLMGYFVFSHDEVQQKVKDAWIPLLACAFIAGGILIGTTFGETNTTPQYQSSPLNCIYGWLACLGLMGWFNAKFDRTGRFAGYMTRTSYGLYIVHYLVVASIGFMLKNYTQLPPLAVYVILTFAVFTLSPLLYEVLHRIPFIRWAVFGEKKVRKSA